MKKDQSTADRLKAVRPRSDGDLDIFQRMLAAIPKPEDELSICDPRLYREAEENPKQRDTGLALVEYPSDVSLEGLIERQDAALVKGIVSPGELMAIYGHPAAGKSFVGLDLCFAVALGRPWHGRKTRRSACLYVTLEGVPGFQKRVMAACAQHGDPELRFGRMKLHVSLARTSLGKKGVDSICEAVAELARVSGGPVGLIAIDTLARAIAGDDENAVADIMHFIETRAGEIARRTGAAVLIIHHANKAGDIRGSTAILGACDAVLRVEKDVERRAVIAEKIKDDTEGPLFDFTLVPRKLGVDGDGEDVTSCTVKSTPPTAKGKPKRRDKVFMAAVSKLADEKSAVAGEVPGVKKPGRRVDLKAVREIFREVYSSDEPDPKKAKDAERSAWRYLMDGVPSGYVVTESHVWVVDQPTEFGPISDAL